MHRNAHQKKKAEMQRKAEQKRVCGHDIGAGVSRHFGHPKKILQIPQPLKGIGVFGVLKKHLEIL